VDNNDDLLVDNDEDLPVTVLTQITDVLELHSKSLADQRKLIEQLFWENTEIKKRVEELEAADSLDSSDKKFLAGITARLALISSAIDAEP